MSIGEFITIELVLDRLLFNSRVALEAGHVNFVVEVTDVADDGVVLHLGHV